MASQGFSYQKTNQVFLSYYRDGVWEQGQLVKDDQIQISLMSTVLHYGQSVFEGLKAYRRKDGRIQLFRVRDNAKRFHDSCQRLVMPTISEDMFIDAVKQTVLANQSFVPPYQEGTLYIRPVMFGVGDNLGLKPSKDYVFAIITSPVGSYFDSQQKGMRLLVSPYDRVASFGTGQAKTGGNYAASMLPQKLAREQGYQDVLFLDPIKHQYIEEVGAANFIAIKDEHDIYTPVSRSILNGITKRSILYIAKHVFNMTVHETKISLSMLNTFTEAAACGTAAVITPIASVTHEDMIYTFKYHNTMGPMTKKLYDYLIGIQFGDLPDPNHWITNLT